MIFSEGDEEAAHNSPIFSRKKWIYESDQPIQNVYNFYKVNRHKPKPFRLDEETFIDSVFGTDAESTTVADAVSEEAKSDIAQKYSFENTLPGDLVALRVEEFTDIRMPYWELERFKKEMNQTELGLPQKQRLSMIGTTLESSNRTEPK